MYMQEFETLFLLISIWNELNEHSIEISCCKQEY
jgi:hypothetical protein